MRSTTLGALALGVVSCALAGCSTQTRTTVAEAPAPAVYGPPPAPASYATVAAAEPAPLKPQVKTAAITFDAPKPAKVVAQTPGSAPVHVAAKGSTGLASFYGAGFQGRRTANGEMFDMHGFTAAHPSLPLPSYVRVTNVTNGRSIVVRVNDRGPYHRGRMLDVSQRTADVLGFRRAGVGNVRMEYIGPAGDGAREDRTLLATYQEFGRPSAPEGMQVAALTPVSDAALLARSRGGAAVLVASATPVAETRSVVAPLATAYASEKPVVGVSTTLKPAASAALASATPITLTPPAPKPATIAVAARTPAVAAPAKRTVAISEPELASVAPVASHPAAKPVAHASPAAPAAAASSSSDYAALAVAVAQPPKSKVNASDRVAASFADFGSFRGSIEGSGPAGAFSGLR